MVAEDGLKAQKLLAQGSALGNIGKMQSRPERAKALKLKAFALSGRVDAKHTLLSGRVDAKHTFLSGRIGCDL